jgi:chromosome partitioning protein
LVDLDPQGNSSTGLGISPSARNKTSYDLLMAEAPFRVRYSIAAPSV